MVWVHVRSGIVEGKLCLDKKKFDLIKFL